MRMRSWHYLRRTERQLRLGSGLGEARPRPKTPHTTAAGAAGAALHAAGLGTINEDFYLFLFLREMETDENAQKKGRWKKRKGWRNKQRDDDS